MILNKRQQWVTKTPVQSLDIWSKKADDLQGFAGTLKYFGIKQSGSGFEIDSLLANSYFRQSLDLFKVVVEKQILKEDIGLPSLELFPQYDALITIIGFSPEPLMHTVLALAPSKVYPIATIESAEYYKVPLNPDTKRRDGEIQFFEAIIEYYKVPQQSITVEPIVRNVSAIGSLETFKQVREIIQATKENNHNAKIALDITGGKKSADASAFLIAAIEEDIDIFYVDFEDYTGAKACCGTEFLNKLDNPYNIYNIQLLNKAKELFKNYNYQAAFQLFTEIEKKLSPNGLNNPAKFDLENERSSVEKMKKTATCYMYWDRYSYSRALCDYEYLPEQQKMHLTKLKEYGDIERKKDRYASEYFYDYVLDRYLSASRRGVHVQDEDLGGYHDAILRYYQCVEVLLDAYITRYQKNDFYDPDCNKYPTNIIRKLCFTGNAEVRKKENRVCLELSNKINDSYLLSKIANLNNWRDGFVHIKGDVQKSNIINAKEMVMRLIEIFFADKQSSEIKNDLLQYNFCKSFNDDGFLLQ
jgi:hypothetical protein